MQTLVDKLKTQKGIVIDHETIPGANHFFENDMDELMQRCGTYVMAAWADAIRLRRHRLTRHRSPPPGGLFICPNACGSHARLNRQSLIRSAKSEDFQGLCALYAQLISNDIAADDDFRLETFHQILTQQSVDLLVGEMEGTLVATCMLIVVPNLTRGCAPFALVENVVTHADWRGSGIGKALLRVATDKAFSAGCFKVMLLSGSANKDAHRFYENHGFTTSKTGFELRAPGYPARN